MNDSEQDQNLNEENNSDSSCSFNPVTHNNAPSFVALLVSAVVLLIIAVFGTIVLTTNLTKLVKDEESANEENKPSGFENLTKEEAFKYIKENGTAHGTLPASYIKDDLSKYIIIEDTVIKREIEIYYSYDKLEDLKKDVAKNYYKSSANPDELFEVKDFEYYTLLIPKISADKPVCATKRTCNILLSFKRKFVDYREVVTSNNHTKTLAITAKNKDEISEIARILSLASSIGFNISSYGNIYDYKFEEQSNKYVLHIDRIYVTRQYNEKTLNAGLYQETYSIGKDDGLITHNSNFGEFTLNHSFKITKEEYDSLPCTH